jgi:hypothetical protein
MMEEIMIFRNEDISGLVTEIPEGHKHLRTTIVLTDGRKITFQEATIAGIVRSYIDVKTHPLSSRAVLAAEKLDNRKAGYAEWQLLETEEI